MFTMDLKELEKGLALRLLEKAQKAESKEEKVKFLMKTLRVLYPLVADTRGKEVLDLYTRLKEGEGLEEAFNFAREVLGAF